MSKKIKKESKVVNFGCRLNTYESDVIKNHLVKNKIKNTIVFNTCAVTEEAERQVKQSIRKFIKEYPDQRIVVTGCGAQINPEKYQSIKGVNYILGNQEKMDKHIWSNFEEINPIMVTNIMNTRKISESIITNYEKRARAYVEIQQGCNHRCTFCTIPFGRGNNRSVPMGLISNRIKELVRYGYNEVVLTGVDITDYGLDLPGKPSLSQMIKRVLKAVPDLSQLRLSTIDCSEIDDDFWDLIKNEERLMPHIHISLQSGDDLILKRMKRRHNRSQVIKFCEKAKRLRPNIVFGADIITGFPTETDDMFKNTSNLIKECDLIYLHVFRYSKRLGTPASKMPQVCEKIKKERSKILRTIGKNKLVEYKNTIIGTQKKILIEQNIKNHSIGRTQEYFKIKIDSNLVEGKIYNLLIGSNTDNILIA